ncbi:Recombination protein RecR [Candidatus Hepatincola sp. Av]
MDNHNTIENTALLLSKLQGIGPRSAKRILFDLMKQKDSLLPNLINALTDLSARISACPVCFNLDVVSPCHICASSQRDKTMICAVEDIAALWAIERTNSYKGVYFVLGGNLSSYKISKPEDLHLDILINKLNNENINELILGLSATLEGQITGNYICEQLQKPLKISMLAQGMPVGGEIDYLDEVTLSTAIKLRKTI